MTRTALVTGARGFLGAPLALELRRRLPGWRLALLSRAPGPGFVGCDLSDARAARRAVRAARPSLVFHLAGRHRDTGAADLWDAHVRATANLLEALRLLPRPPRVVVAGSSAEYGSCGRDAASETSPCSPRGAYGSSKLCQTLLSLSYAHEGVPVCVARVFNVLGPGLPEDLSLGSFAAQLARIEKGLAPARLRVGNLSPRRDYVDARDAARALALVALRGRAGEVYNVCSGRSHPMRALVRRLLGLCAARVRVEVDPARVRAADVPDMRGSRAKILRETGWRPLLPLQDSLRDTLEWHRRK